MKYQVGDLVQIKNNRGKESQYYHIRGKVGKIIKVDRYWGNVHYDVEVEGKIYRNVGSSVFFKLDDTYKMEGVKMETLSEQADALNRQLSEVYAKIDFMKDFGLETFDAKLYKAYKMYQIVHRVSGNGNNVSVFSEADKEAVYELKEVI